MAATSSESNVVLIGFMGSGKSSVGRRVAEGLGYRFIDTDALVVRRAGMPIPQIFREQGEDGFRDIESAVLESLAEEKGIVLATGGGIVTRPGNVRLLHQLGLVIWLTASEDVIFRRVAHTNKRPLLQTSDPRATVSELLNRRRPLYAAAANWTLDSTSLSHQEAADAIISKAGEFELCDDPA